jgi:hypothetical protein
MLEDWKMDLSQGREMGEDLFLVCFPEIFTGVFVLYV